MTVVTIALVVIGAVVALSGLRKIFTRRGVSYRWHYERPNIAVREDLEQSGFRAVAGGLVRVVVGALLITLGIIAAG